MPETTSSSLDLLLLFRFEVICYLEILQAAAGMPFRGQEATCRQRQPLLHSGHVPAHTCRISSGVLPATGDASITDHTQDAMSRVVTWPRSWQGTGRRTQALPIACCSVTNGVLTFDDVCNRRSTQVPTPTEVWSQFSDFHKIAGRHSMQGTAGVQLAMLTVIRSCSQ